MRGGTCRCVMCGIKQAGKCHRGLYIRYGVRTDEKPVKGLEKKQGRRKLRRRLNRCLQ